MTLRLPPKHVVFPSNAIFRKYPLPPDLLETWQLLRALAWVNRYEYTPPVSLGELLALHHNIKARSLEYRLMRLEMTGWLKIQHTNGRANVYTPIVPDDKPIDYSTETAVHGGEPASVIRQDDGEDSARHAPMVKSVVTATPAIGCRGASSSRISDQSESSIDESTTTIMSRAREILAAVNVRVCDLNLSGMSVERAERIAAYVRDNHDKKRSPAGYVYSVLANNPDWEPPSPRRKTWYGKYADLVVR